MSRFTPVRLLQLEGLMKEVHEFACNKLNINTVRINMSYNTDSRCSGFANKGLVSDITIIESKITTYDRLVDTILHETRHIWQFQYTDYDWKWDEYVTSDVDHVAYYNHVAEVNARNFAKKFAIMFRDELDAMIEKCENNLYEMPQPKIKQYTEEDLFFGIFDNEPVWG